jgi:formylglycine-generating enzyme required for sulfatase activity
MQIQPLPSLSCAHLRVMVWLIASAAGWAAAQEIVLTVGDRESRDYIPLSWEPVPEATDYAVYRVNPDGPFSILVEASDVFGYHDHDVEPGIVYEYYLSVDGGPHAGYVGPIPGELAWPDNDGDGMLDEWEERYFGDDTRAGSGDFDDDDVSDLDEHDLGLDPVAADSEGDGMADGWELDYGFDPLWQYDAGLDADGDGFTNADEAGRDSHPLINDLDLDGSGGIDPVIGDLAVVRDHFRRGGAAALAAADIDRDGAVGISDALRLAGASLPRPAPDMVPIPGGTFLMGDMRGDSTSDELAALFPDGIIPPGAPVETPVHSVTLSPFWIGRYKVTNAQLVEMLNWALEEERIVADEGSAHNTAGVVYRLLRTDSRYGDPISYLNGSYTVRPGREDHPASNITWYGAAYYCNLRSEREGLTPAYDLTQEQWPCDARGAGYRLPTEAEYEFVARNGRPDSRFPWGDTIDHTRSNYRANSTFPSYDVSGYTNGRQHPAAVGGPFPHTTPVTYFPPSEKYGLFELCGNVPHWCQDWYSEDYYADSAPLDPTGPATGEHKALRGGQASANAFPQRVAARMWREPAGHGGGIRPVLPIGDVPLSLPAAAEAEPLVLTLVPDRTSVASGDTVSVAISIGGAERLAGCDLGLRFDNDQLQYTGMTSGDLLGEPADEDAVFWMAPPSTVTAELAAKVAGLAAVRLDPWRRSGSHAGTLATLHFTARDADAAAQASIAVDMTSSTLANFDGHSLSFAAEPVVLAVTPAAAPQPLRPEIEVSAGVVNAGSEVRVAISLDPGDQRDAAAEYWIAARLPGGAVYHYVAATRSWAPGMAPSAAAPAVEMSGVEVLRHRGLPRGRTRFYFAIDPDPDGRLADYAVDAVTVVVR